jgi:hypothetical protein
MKILFTFFLVAFWGLSNCHAQAGKVIPVPVVAESPLLDSLMERMIRNREKYNTTHIKLPDTGCWRLEIFRSNDPAYPDILQSFESTEPVINYTINQMGGDTSGYSCFAYRGFKVFVWCNRVGGDFFTNTSSVKTFSFIYKLAKGQSRPPERELHGRQQLFRYLGGHLIDGAPPVVIPRSN